MGSKIENFKQKMSGIGQKLSEAIGFEPVFAHNSGCVLRGGLKKIYEEFKDEKAIAKYKITRTCGACGASDSYTENKVVYSGSSSW